MAYDFATAGDLINYGKAAALNDISPMTVAGWIYKDSAGHGTTGGRFYDKNNDQFAIGPTQPYGSISYQTTNLVHVTNTAYDTGSWNHCAMTWSGSTTLNAVALYKNGSQSANNGELSAGVGTRVSNSSADLFIGNRSDAARTFDGRMGEIAFWKVVLTGAEITALAKGFSPHRIRPQSLVLCARLVRNSTDIKGNSSSVTGTAVADHPRVY